MLAVLVAQRVLRVLRVLLAVPVESATFLAVSVLVVELLAERRAVLLLLPPRHLRLVLPPALRRARRVPELLELLVLVLLP